MVSVPRFMSAEDPCNEQFKEGDLVQLYNGSDSVWACIVDVKTRGYFDGIVSTRHLLTKSYTFGDLIRFHRRHIQGFSLTE
jgi:hypothetical protein